MISVSATRFSNVTSGIATVGALLVVAAPFIFTSPEYGQMLNLPFGLLLLVSSGYYTYALASGMVPYRGASGLAFVCGFALFVTPFLTDAGSTFMMVDLVVGVGSMLIYGYEILSGAGHTTPFKDLATR